MQETIIADLQERINELEFKVARLQGITQGIINAWLIRRDRGWILYNLLKATKYIHRGKK